MPADVRFARQMLESSQRKMSDNVEIPGYRVLRTLGSGGMATVYLAEQESLEREVALKVMAPVLAANADFCQQFIKEGRITAKLSHPNLVTVYDIGSYRGTYYMASEFLPAGSLRDRLQERIAVGDALAIARDVACGLSYAHDKGFVHRDVKPGNILFRANGSAVLADFGIAKAITTIGQATMAGNAIGTPDYMSPEQAQATLVDGRSDFYSLGAVLFEMLSGRKPYVAGDPYAVALRHITEPVPKLPDALTWLQPLIDQMMAKDRELRFASGAAFIAAADALLRDHPEIATQHDRRREREAAVVKPGGVEGDRLRTLGLKRWIIPLASVFVLAAGLALGWHWLHPSTTSDGPRPSSGVRDTPESIPPGPSQSTDPVAAAGLDQLDMPALLARAGKYLDQGLRSDDGKHLSFPDGDNAIDLFREALRRDPANAAATQGLAQIAAFYARGAKRTFDRGLDTFTQELIEKGLRAEPQDPALLKLKADLAARSAAAEKS